MGARTCMWIRVEISVYIDLLREDLTQLLGYSVPIDSMSCQILLVVDFTPFNKLHDQSPFCGRYNPAHRRLSKSMLPAQARLTLGYKVVSLVLIRSCA